MLVCTQVKWLYFKQENYQSFLVFSFIKFIRSSTSHEKVQSLFWCHILLNCQILSFILSAARFFFKNNNRATVRMCYSTSKIRLDLTRLDEFLLHYSDNFHAFIYEGCHHTSPEIPMPRLRVHFLRISKQV